MTAETHFELPETSRELLALLAGRLTARRKERGREAMPCMDIVLRDGTVLTVTLNEHHPGGTE